MKKNVWLLFLLVLFAVCPGQGQNTELRLYQNKDLNFQFQYPATWTIEDESKDLDYLSLYSPEALTTKEQSLDLLVGIKTEVYLLPSKEEVDQGLQDLKQCGEIKINNTMVKQYCLQTPECFFTYAPVPTDSGIILFIAYIPEQAKVASYFKTYTSILLSFSKTENGSP